MQGFFLKEALHIHLDNKATWQILLGIGGYYILNNII